MIRNIISTRHLIELDNFINHNCILKSSFFQSMQQQIGSGIDLGSKEASKSSIEDVEIQEKDQLFIRGTLRGQLQSLLARICKQGSADREQFLTLAHKLSLQFSLDERDPYLVIIHCLFAQLPTLKESPSQSLVKTTLKIFVQFFQALNIKILIPIMLQLQDLLKKIFQPLGSPVQVSNLWNQRSKRFQCYCQLYQQKSRQICYKCRQLYHQCCFWPKRSEKYEQCPICFITYCLPHRPVQQLLFLGYLQHLPLESVEYKMKFHVSMNSHDPSAKYELRCIRINENSRYALTLPDSCTFVLGGKQVKRVEAPSQASEIIARRRDRSIDIGWNLLNYVNYLTVKVNNTLKQGSKGGDNHLIAIVVSKEYTNIPKILEEKYSLVRLSILKSKNFLRGLLNKYGDDCFTDTLTVSFRCQYFFTNIEIPVRSKQCTSHYQPFDLHNFIKISLSTDNAAFSWRCPVCRVRAYDLVVDEYLLDLIQKNKRLVSVVFDREGEVSSVDKEQEAEVISLDNKESHCQQLGAFSRGVEALKQEEKEKEKMDLKEFTLKRTLEERQLKENEIEQLPPRKMSIPPRPIEQNEKRLTLTESQVEAVKQRLRSLILPKTTSFNPSPDLKISQVTQNSQKSSKHPQIPPAPLQPAQDEDSSDSVEIVLRNPLEDSILRDHKARLLELKGQLGLGLLTAAEKTRFNELTRRFNHWTVK